MISMYITGIVASFLIVFSIATLDSRYQLQASGDQWNMIVDNTSISASLPNQESNTTEMNITEERYPAGTLQVPYTGLIRNQISPENAKLLGLNSSTFGMIVAEVLPNSPAEEAGFIAGNITRSVNGDIMRLGGDIILEVDGNKSAIRSNEAYVNYLEDVKNVGDNVTFTVLREGKLGHLNLTIGGVPHYFWYENPDEGIRIAYPSDWEVSEENLKMNDVVKFFSPEQSPKNGAAAAAGLFLKIFPAGEFGLDTLARRDAAGSATSRNLHVNFGDLGGLPAYESVFYDYGDANRTLKILSTFTIKDGKQIYRINFAADPSEYDEYLPIVRTMIDSFQFTAIP